MNCESWVDLFAHNATTADNADWIARYGKWSSFVVSPESRIGRTILGEQADVLAEYSSGFLVEISLRSRKGVVVIRSAWDETLASVEPYDN